MVLTNIYYLLLFPTTCRKKDLAFVQKLALDRTMQVHQDQHKDVPASMFNSMPSIIEAVLRDADHKYSSPIAKMQPLTSSPSSVVLMLYLNDSTDPGFQVRAMYNNIFIWHPVHQVDRRRERCNPDREYATLQSWLDQQAPSGICVYVRPGDSILLKEDHQNVTQRLRHHVMQDQSLASLSSDTARKVFFVGPVNEDIIPKMSPYLQKCIPKLVDEYITDECNILLCVISIDVSINSIKDICAPLPGFDMNIITPFGPMEFSPSCFVLKIARRQ